MTKDIHDFLNNGCGRCKLYATPNCKVIVWQEILLRLREIAQSSKLQEQMKWGFPCYSTAQNKNVFSIAAFNQHCSINFFKGALIKDPFNVLTKAGENSQSMRSVKITSLEQLAALKPNIERLISLAIEVEKSGIKLQTLQANLPYPEELTEEFEDDGLFKNAFEQLTPGRIRGYLLFFNQAKQSSTRKSRIAKYKTKILSGKGFHD